MDISTPYVKINIDKVETNIKNMMGKLNEQGINHRPHIKPHKNIDLAKLQLNNGACGITCATLYEVKVMAENGISDILLAFPIVGKENLSILKNLLKKHDFTFTTIVDSEKGVKDLSILGESLNVSINVLVDIDSGAHREGIQLEELIFFAHYIYQLPNVRLKGLFTYNGQIYGKSKSEMSKSAYKEAQILKTGKQRLEDEGYKVDTLSAGSTVSSLYPAQLKGITESRAGNYIFYDMNAIHSEIATMNNCALTIIAQVISLPYPGHATIDAGSKAMTSDDPLKGNEYGKIINKENIKIIKLNEEHGFLTYDTNKVNLSVGDRVEIIPNHACVVPNLHESVFIFRNEEFVERLITHARGRLYTLEDLKEVQKSE